VTADPFDSHRDEAGEVRVRFGPGVSQTMPIDWAEDMLSKLKEKDPKRFGDYLSQAAMNAQ
jgi:hypothetical protein